MTTPQVIEKIRDEIINSGRDNRFHLSAYDFLLNGLEFYLTSLGEKRHVTGQELARGLLVFAYKQFGLLAKDVLEHWGITKTDHFGYIVYNMIEIGVMSKQPEDKVEHFFNVVTFTDFFEKQQYFEIDKDFIKKTKGA